MEKWWWSSCKSSKSSCWSTEKVNEFKSVFAKTLKITKKTRASDTCLAILKFKNGALGSIEATTATRPSDLEGSISILGENGTVVVGGYAVSKMNGSY